MRGLELVSTLSTISTIWLGVIILSLINVINMRTYKYMALNGTGGCTQSKGQIKTFS